MGADWGIQQNLQHKGYFSKNGHSVMKRNAVKSSVTHLHAFAQIAYSPLGVQKVTGSNPVGPTIVKVRFTQKIMGWTHFFVPFRFRQLFRFCAPQVVDTRVGTRR